MTRAGYASGMWAWTMHIHRMSHARAILTEVLSTSCAQFPFAIVTERSKFET